MYFTSLPDHSAPGFNEQLHFSQFRKRNIIFSATSSQARCDRHVGCLSIKTVLNGIEWYGIGQQQIAVRPGHFLMLNDHQEYACWVDRHASATILSVFFGSQFASSVLQDAVDSEESLLDNFSSEGTARPEFFQTLNPIHDTLGRALTHLAARSNAPYHQNEIDEHLIPLLHEVLHTHRAATRRVNQIMSVKPATRREVYKRLCVAKDFMHAGFMNDVDLAALGQAACLSVPQLVRQFKAAFRTTPHQYLTQIRLNHAAALLKHSEAPVQEIATACGFENTSAFCRLFKSAHGSQPLAYRALHA